MKTRTIVIGVCIWAFALVAIVVINMVASRGKKAAAPQQAASRSASASSPTPLADPKWVTGHRITVELLNATKVRGLARRAALSLRDQGFDVVSTGNNHDQFDTTQVLDRTGHRDWAERAAKAMGGGTVLVRPDSSRQVDLTVLIGSTWRVPTEPFYP